MKFAKCRGVLKHFGTVYTKSKNMNRTVISKTMVVMILGILLTGVWGCASQEDSSTSEATSESSIIGTKNYQKLDNTIEIGTQYAYKSDECNVYIATAISDSVIIIENWNKIMNIKIKMKYKYDIGAFKINDNENGFSWIDEEHTAFTFVFRDKNNLNMERTESHIFTRNINDDAYSKGTDYNKDIACYKYVCDDGHMYRAIPLTDSVIKIECWARHSTLESFLFGWDWCLIDWTTTDTDFEWTDENHNGFTITTQDLQNDYYWKEPTFVAFMLENENYKYNSVNDYINGVTVTPD